MIINEEKFSVISQIRKELYNYDLAIVFARGQIELYEAKMNESANGKSNGQQKKFILAKIKRDKYKMYLDDLIKSKRKVVFGIQDVVNKYNYEYQDIFMDYFIFKRDKKYIYVKNKQKYSIGQVDRIIEKLENEIVYYFNENQK